MRRQQHPEPTPARCWSTGTGRCCGACAWRPGTPARAEQTAWIECVPSKERVSATLVSGLGSEAVDKVVLEVEGRSPVEVPAFRRRGIPFAFWVVAPLPPDARPLACGNGPGRAGHVGFPLAATI